MARCGCVYHPWYVISNHGFLIVGQIKIALRTSKLYGWSVWGLSTLMISVFHLHFKLLELSLKERSKVCTQNCDVGF